ncbi:MAG: hypothetical protein OEW82_06705 [Dehalococcoidia bacterium]|nr:hypothetical protein [Dehalococcoidia bacterium]
MGKGTRVAIFSVTGAFLAWNKGGSHEYRRCIMTVLEKIKSFFKRGKPPKVAKEKPLEVAGEKPPEAPREKP